MHRYSGLFQTVRIKHIPAMWLVIVIACAFCFQCSETACRADGIGEEPALSQTVDLSMTGRRISLQSLLEALEGDPVNGVGWGVECIIDHKALRQQGVHYDEILINDFELKGTQKRCQEPFRENLPKSVPDTFLSRSTARSRFTYLLTAPRSMPSIQAISRFE
jgi:hypothetical protein